MLVSTVNFNNLGGNKKLKAPFVGPFVIKKLHGRNAVEVILSEELSRKHPVFPVSLIKPYDTRKDFDSSTVVVSIPILEEIPSEKLKVHKILKDKKERINGKDTRLYLVRFKNQSADKDQWLPEDNIPDASIHLRNFRVSKRK